MKQNGLKMPSRPKKMLPVLALAAALSGNLAGNASADLPPSPWDNRAEATEFGSPVSVSFDNLNVYLGSQPVNRNGTVMVQAEPLLKSLGYHVTWDAKAKKLTAEHTGKASLAFSDKRAEAVLGDRTVHALPAAPFVLQGQLWIPLRWTAESCGFVVTWNASGSFVTVRDPDARFHLRVGTRAENGITEQPSGLIQYIKADWNTDVQIDLVVPQNFSDKTKIKIAAGDMDTLMLLPDAHEFQDDLLQSIALDLSKSLESAPTLKKLANDPDLPVRKISGKTYAIPRPSDLNDAPFPALRQDWMDKLGSKKPETMDEMFDVLRQFVNKDPDGDGKNNTIGLYGYVNANNLGSLSWVEHAYTGFPERFGISESGTVVDHALGKGQRQALEWLGRANAAGLLNKDFATVDRETAVDAVKKGKTGLAVLKFDEAAKMTLDNMGH